MLSSFLNPDTSKFDKEATEKIVSMKQYLRINNILKIKDKSYRLIRQFYLPRPIRYSIQVLARRKVVSQLWKIFNRNKVVRRIFCKNNQ